MSENDPCSIPSTNSNVESSQHDRDYRDDDWKDIVVAVAAKDWSDDGAGDSNDCAAANYLYPVVVESIAVAEPSVNHYL